MAGMTQLKGRIVFIGMVAIIILIAFLSIQDNGSNHKIEFIRYRHIYSIRMDDRGMAGGNSMIIKNKDSLAGISKLLIGSKPVDFNQINIKPNKGTCYITVNYDDKQNMELSLTNAASGGIIESGSYRYVNDPLLNFVIDRVKNISSIQYK
jgi:hypothetical protein